MNYIKPEQFLALDEKVQKVFINWWEPQVFDLAYCKESLKESAISKIELRFFKEEQEWSQNTKFIPLLQMHQLVQFIEDKANKKIDILLFKEGYTICMYDIVIESNEYYPTEYEKDTGCLDIFQALFQVAVEIAGKEVENEQN